MKKPRVSLIYVYVQSFLETNLKCTYKQKHLAVPFSRGGAMDGAQIYKYRMCFSVRQKLNAHQVRSYLIMI